MLSRPSRRQNFELQRDLDQSNHFTWPPNDELARKDRPAHSLHSSNMVTLPQKETPSERNSLVLGNSERNGLLKPESRQNSSVYAEPADAIAYKSAIISIRQFRSNPAPNNYRHREQEWLQTPASGAYDLRHPIEWNELYQTSDKRLLISSSADNWTQRLCTKDKTKKSPWAQPNQHGSSSKKRDTDGSAGKPCLPINRKHPSHFHVGSIYGPHLF